MNEGEITIVGNLTRDPELRVSQAGKDWATFSVAVNWRRTPPGGGEPIEKVRFYNCKVFGQQAANMASLAKGNRIVVSGRLEDEEWKASDGSDRKTEVLVVMEVAASLRFSSVSVQATTRSGSSPAYGQGSQAAQPAQAGTPAGPDPFAADSEQPF
jgi:single-strand DNA-binding protein